MNIALFTDCYFPTKNGVVTVVHQLRESLELLGHHVVIVTTKPDVEYEEDPNIYRAVNSLPLPLGGAKDQYVALIWWPKLKIFLLKHKIEIIHCHTELTVGRMGYKAARRLNIPCVMTTHTMWEDYIRNYLHLFENYLPIRMLYPYLRNIYKHFSCLIGVSDKVRAYNKRDYVSPNIPCVVIHNALNPEKFMANGTEEGKQKASEIRKKLGIKDDEKMLLYVGRIAVEKRSLDLYNSIVAVLEKDSKLKMVFVGDGPIYKQLLKNTQYTSVKDRIIFTGFVEWKEIGSYYKAADLFVTSSTTESTCPMVVIEAFIGATPVICPKDEAYSFSVINGETGFQAESDDDFVEKILKVCKDDKLLLEMSKKAQEKSKEFMPGIFVKRHLYLYQTILDNYNKKTIDEIAVQRELDKIKE